LNHGKNIEIQLKEGIFMIQKKKVQKEDITFKTNIDQNLVPEN
jgi:hypothetical protein